MLRTPTSHSANDLIELNPPTPEGKTALSITNVKKIESIKYPAVEITYLVKNSGTFSERRLLSDEELAKNASIITGEIGLRSIHTRKLIGKLLIGYISKNTRGYKQVRILSKVSIPIESNQMIEVGKHKVVVVRSEKFANPGKDQNMCITFKLIDENKLIDCLYSSDKALFSQNTKRLLKQELPISEINPESLINLKCRIKVFEENDVIKVKILKNKEPKRAQS